MVKVYRLGCQFIQLIVAAKVVLFPDSVGLVARLRPCDKQKGLSEQLLIAAAPLLESSEE